MSSFFIISYYGTDKTAYRKTATISFALKSPFVFLPRRFAHCISQDKLR